MTIKTNERYSVNGIIIKYIGHLIDESNFNSMLNEVEMHMNENEKLDIEISKTSFKGDHYEIISMNSKERKHEVEKIPIY